jgi:hypothetical protein
LSECDLFSASFNIAFKDFYFEGHFKPEVRFMQVDDGLTHMLDEVFDERLENKSESSVRAP